jgi:hypothetical protein
LLLGAWSGCGSSPAPDPTIVPAANWGTAVAAVMCGQIFGCCDATERMHWGYADEAQCQQMIAAAQQMNLDQLLQIGWVTYDGKAARRCLDESLAAGCQKILANGSVGVAGPSCPDITRGTGQLGATCEDLDVICASSNCLPSSGTCGPPRACPAACGAGQYCDEAAGGCTPVKTDGSTCSSNAECASPSVCRTGACGAPLSDGAACSTGTDCANGACVHSGPTTAACGPLLPDGSPCTLTTDCANGGCTAGASGGAVCGPRFCDGV